MSLVQRIRRALGRRRPRYSSLSTKRGYGGTPTTSTAYEAMDKNYRWFRQDEMVRRCLVTNAYFATLAAGYETVLQVQPDEKGVMPSDPEAVLEQYAWVKKRVDDINRRVNFDNVLFVSQLKRSIYGKAAWEIGYDEDELPEIVVALRSEYIKPQVDETWQLTGFKSTQPGAPRDGYPVEKILYFTNLSLESDYEGISDVEPVRGVCEAKYELLTENFHEIVRTVWAPYVILQADTSMMPEDEETSLLEDLADIARSGKSIAVNTSVEPKIVSLNIDFQGLLGMLGSFEEAILRAFGTPRSLVMKQPQNRATAYAELEAYVNGPISSIQRYLKREVEQQWYSRIVERLFEKEGVEGAPVKVVHQWKPIRTQDFIEMANAAATLWGTMATGPIGGNRRKVWELLGWDISELPEEEQTQQAAHTAENSHIETRQWNPRLTAEERSFIAQGESQTKFLANQLIELVNQAITGAIGFEETMEKAAVIIASYVELSKKEALKLLRLQYGIDAPTLSPEEERNFNEERDRWINDFNRILTDALKGLKTPIGYAGLPFNKLPYRAFMAENKDYWKTTGGVRARLEALSHDLVFRTYNNALQIYGSKAGFKWFEWVTQPALTATGPCSICAPREGRIYRRGQFMPQQPAHVGCVCIWRIIEERPEKE